MIINFIVSLIVSRLTKPTPNKIKDLVFQKSENKETNYFSQDALLTYLLIACVFIIWFIFS